MDPDGLTAGAPGSTSATATGRVIKKKRKVIKKLRVEGSVSILDYNLSTLGYHNCTSGGSVPYIRLSVGDPASCSNLARLIGET